MRWFYACFLLSIFSSCSSTTDNETNFDGNSFPQRWQLMGMSTGISGGFLEGQDLPCAETILLQKDGSFVKTRWLDDEKKEGSGLFEFNKIGGETYLVLDYEAETDLIENCTKENRVEALFMPSTNSLTGGAAPCDGPGFYYERVE